MRSLLRSRKNKEKKETIDKAAASSPAVLEHSREQRRRPSSVHTNKEDKDRGEAWDDDDDASTIRETRSIAPSLFDDTASTLQPDTYEALGTRNATTGAATASYASASTSASAGTRYKSSWSAAAAVEQDYWDSRPEPFNPFDEVAKLPQHERVAIAMKNAKGPQFKELSLSFGRAGHII